MMFNPQSKQPQVAAGSLAKKLRAAEDQLAKAGRGANRLAPVEEGLDDKQVPSGGRVRKTLTKSERLARAMARWQKRLAPQLPDMDPHDLNLILWSMLRRRYGGQRRIFLRRRQEGGYVY
jgi:hypothetical protein